MRYSTCETLGSLWMNSACYRIIFLNFEVTLHFHNCCSRSGFSFFSTLATKWVNMFDCCCTCWCAKTALILFFIVYQVYSATAGDTVAIQINPIFAALTETNTLFVCNENCLLSDFPPLSFSLGLAAGRESARCAAVGGGPHVWASSLHDPCFWPEKWDTVSPSGKDSLLFAHKMKRWFHKINLST